MQRFTVRLKVTHKELHVASTLIFMHEPHAFTSKTKIFILFRHFYNILFFSLSKESKFILVVNASATSFFMHPKTSIEWFQPKIIDTAWQYKARIELTFLLAEFVVLMRFFWMFLLDTAISGFIWLLLSIVHFTLKMASKRAFNLCVAIILTSSFSLRFILKWSLLSHMCNARAWQKFMASTVFDDKSLFYGILRNFSTRWWHLNDFFFAFRSSLFFAVSLFILLFINARLKWSLIGI